jgi:DNA-binding NarL/FixJ family response regulator
MEPAAFRERYATLTARQREILTLRCQGLTNKEMAWRLFVQERTITNHMTHILTRLGRRGRRGSAAVCVQLRLDEANR